MTHFVTKATFFPLLLLLIFTAHLKAAGVSYMPPPNEIGFIGLPAEGFIIVASSYHRLTNGRAELCIDHCTSRTGNWLTPDQYLKHHISDAHYIGLAPLTNNEITLYYSFRQDKNALTKPIVGYFRLDDESFITGPTYTIQNKRVMVCTGIARSRGCVAKLGGQLIPYLTPEQYVKQYAQDLDFAGLAVDSKRQVYIYLSKSNGV